MNLLIFGRNALSAKYSRKALSDVMVYIYADNNKFSAAFLHVSDFIYL